MPAKSLEQLAADAAEGNLDAADALVRGVHEHVFAFLHVRGIPANDINDVAQKTALEMLSSLSRYSIDKPFLPWFRAIARNVSSVYWRNRKKETDRMSLFHETITPLIESMPDETELHERRRKGLAECIERLQERQKRLVTMRYHRKLDSFVIAEHLNMKAAAVRKILSRIRAALHACVEDKMTAIVEKR